MVTTDTLIPPAFPFAVLVLRQNAGSKNVHLLGYYMWGFLFVYCRTKEQFLKLAKEIREIREFATKTSEKVGIVKFEVPNNCWRGIKTLRNWILPPSGKT
jgi:hypothetical protein